MNGVSEVELVVVVLAAVAMTLWWRSVARVAVMGVLIVLLVGLVDLLSIFGLR